MPPRPNSQFGPEEEQSPGKAREIQQIIAELRELLAREFHVARSRDKISEDAPLFGNEIGLCSLDGLELLAVLETEYGVTLDDELLFDAMPTLRSIATHLSQTGP